MKKKWIREHGYKGNKKNYEEWKEELLDKIKIKNEIPTIRDFNEWKLPSSRWFVKHCNNDKVKDFNTFIEYELHMKPRYFMSKEMATEIILKCYNEIGKSPTKKDLKPYISESVIKRIWGTLNNMKLELELDICGYNRQNEHIGFKELKENIINVCNNLLLSDINKNVITTKDITENCIVTFGTFENIFKLNGTTVRNILKENGIELQKEGQGYTYLFDDGEKTKSQFEYNFSKYLKEIGYVYNKDYFRDVRYKTFINDYNGLLDCDYEIHINNKKIYIEIAGVLRDYKNKYKTPELIKSKSKSRYAEKLNIKEAMLKNNNLEYYILFPSDLKDLDNLFNNILYIGRKD